VSAFRDRSLAGQRFPYVFVDATYCKARVNRRVVSQAVVVATGVCADGRREVLGFAVGDSEDGAFWTQFLRSLKARGLSGVQLVIADAHLGLRQAVQATMAGAATQRNEEGGGKTGQRRSPCRGGVPGRPRGAAGGAGRLRQRRRRPQPGRQGRR
jgi:Transposase, Mutator family